MNTGTGRWTTLGAVPPQALATARVELHHAAQFVAAVGHSLLPARPDDSHTSMGWDGGRRAFVGEAIEAGRPFRAALEPASLTLHLLDVAGGGAPFATLDLCGRASAEALGWLNAEAAKLGPTRTAYVTLLAFPTPIPDHPVAQGAAFGAGNAERGEVCAYFGNAAALLRDEFTGGGAVPVRIWPHHFDIAGLLSVPGASTDATVGIGLSPGDGAGDEPYWYVNRWPHPPVDRLHDLPPLPGGLGRWNTEGWVGAALPASAMLKAGPDQRGTALAFLRTAANALQAL